mgnify:FL=1
MDEISIKVHLVEQLTNSYVPRWDTLDSTIQPIDTSSRVEYPSTALQRCVNGDRKGKDSVELV